MCDPITISIALAVATTAASVVGQVKAANAQEKAIRQNLHRAEAEIDQKASGDINERLRAQRREQARIKVAAGEAGLQLGGSIETLLKDSLMQSQLSAERTMSNRERALHGAREEANSALSQVEKPTVLGAALQLGSAAVSGYSQGQSINLANTAASSAAGTGG